MLLKVWRSRSRDRAEVALAVALAGLVLGIPAPADDSAGPAETSLQLINPYSAGALPGQLDYVLWDSGNRRLDSGRVLRIERSVSVRVSPSAREISISAEGFEESRLPLALAKQRGVILAPWASVHLTGLPLENPLPQVRIWLRRTNGKELLRKTTVVESNASLRFSLPAGSWDAVLRMPAFAPITTRFVVRPGEEARVPVERARPGLTVNLRAVTSERETAVAGAHVKWLPAQPLRKPEAGAGLSEPTPPPSLIEVALSYDDHVSDAEGRVTIGDLPRGPHMWAARADGYRKAEINVFAGDADTKKEVNLRLEPLPDIRLRVEDRDTPPAALTVEALRRPTGAEPRVPFERLWMGPAPKGDGRLFKSALEADYRFDLRDAAGVLQCRRFVSTRSTEWRRPEVLITLARDPREVHGTIRWGDQPLVGALVFAAVPSQTWPPEDFIPPQEKLFEMASRTSPSGDYSLTLGGPGIYRIAYAFPERSLDGIVGIADVTTERSAQLDTTIARGEVSVRVVAASDEAPIPRARITVSLRKERDDPVTSRGFSTETDDDGFFRVGGLKEGAASVTAAAEGFESKTVQLTVADADAATLLTISLRRTAALRLRIVDLRGLPVAGAEVDRMKTWVPGELEPGLEPVGESDSAGSVVVQDPVADLQPFFVLARGYRLELALAAPDSSPDSTTEREVVLTPIEAGASLRLANAKGQPRPNGALAFGRSSVFFPWALLLKKVRQEGLAAQSALVSGADGEIFVHNLLGPGEYQAFAFWPAQYPEHPKHRLYPLARVSLPLLTSTTLTFHD